MLNYIKVLYFILVIAGFSVFIVNNPYHKYSLGNCFQYKGESWEIKPICKIIQIGKAKYLYSCPIIGMKFNKEDNIFKVIDNTTLRVDCPAEH